MLRAQNVLAFSLQHFSAIMYLRRLNSGPLNYKYFSAIANLCFMVPIKHRSSQRSLKDPELPPERIVLSLSPTIPPHPQTCILMLTLVLQVRILSSCTTVASEFSLYHVCPIFCLHLTAFYIFVRLGSIMVSGDINLIYYYKIGHQNFT